MATKKTKTTKKTASANRRARSAKTTATPDLDQLQRKFESTFEDAMNIAAEIAALETDDVDEERIKQELADNPKLSHPETMAIKAYRVALAKLDATDRDLTVDEKEQAEKQANKAYYATLIRDLSAAHIDALIDDGEPEDDESKTWIPQGARVPEDDAADIEIWSDGVNFNPREALYAREGILMAAHLFYNMELPLQEYDSFFSLANTFARAFDAIRRDELLDKVLS